MLGGTSEGARRPHEIPEIGATEGEQEANTSPCPLSAPSLAFLAEVGQLLFQTFQPSSQVADLLLDVAVHDTAIPTCPHRLPRARADSRSKGPVSSRCVSSLGLEPARTRADRGAEGLKGTLSVTVRACLRLAISPSPPTHFAFDALGTHLDRGGTSKNGLASPTEARRRTTSRDGYMKRGSSGGERAGAMGGGSWGRPRWTRIFCTTAVSLTNAMMRRRPPQ